MKKINKFFTYSLVFIASSLFVLSCEDDDIESDSGKVIPKIFNLQGSTLTFENSTSTYAVTPPRGGSEYIWTVTGAEVKPISGRTDKINLYFNQTENPVSVSVVEKAFNGLVSEASQIDVTVVCNPKPGVYRIEMHDSADDGWQTDGANGGAGITVNVDGNIVEFGMCNPYEDSEFDCPTGDFSNAEATVTIPEGTISATWSFPGDEYGEISFEIYGPDNTLAFASGGPGETEAGQLPVVVCAN
ncbi:hypothetical protein ACFFU9_06650 [Mariniflexile ostreae]|uniref:PKD domain-containing protein n=1 Tax=Mariniflexile ostreae TaxID=1520892 RepID=A0ABV5FAG5_9FLAO